MLFIQAGTILGCLCRCGMVLKMNKCSCSFTLAFHNLWFKEKDGVFLGLDLHFGPYGPATELFLDKYTLQSRVEEFIFCLLEEECQ